MRGWVSPRYSRDGGGLPQFDETLKSAKCLGRDDAFPIQPFQKQSFGIQCSTYQIFLTATDRIGSFSGPIKIREHVGGLLEFYHRAAG